MGYTGWMFGLFLIGCFLHVGVPPTSSWWVAQAENASIEPELDTIFSQALQSSLAGRNALGTPAASPVHVRVVIADWSPSLRSGDQLLYEARLTIEAVTPTETRRFSVSRLVPDPGSAGAAQELRTQVFHDLVGIVADLVADWLTSLMPAG